MGRYERSAAESALRHWGPRYRRILESTGFSSFSVFAGLFEGNSGVFTSRVLIPDMDGFSWKVNGWVWSIPTDYAWALVARYSLPPRPDGALYEHKEVAYALNITPSAYAKRLSRAKKKISEKMFQ